MDEERDRRRVAWVASKVMPHEPLVRAWLAGRVAVRDDIDDLVQEAYCRLAELAAFETVERPDAYFFQTVRNLLRNQMKRARVVRIDLAADLDHLGMADEGPGPELAAGDRRELSRVAAVMDGLPERCRQIFELRRIEGLSQKAIAQQLGVTESVVENEGARGLRLILAGLRDQGDGIAEQYEARLRRPSRS